MLKVKSKSQLVEWLSGAQIVLLACALSIFGWWVKEKIGNVTRSQIVDSNQLVAEQMGRLLSNIGSERFEVGDENWEKFQSIVEETKLPNDGYLCIADAKDGRLLCHPQIREHPQLRATRLDSLIVRSTSQRLFNIFDNVKSDSAKLVKTGFVGVPGETEIVSAAYLPNIGGVLFAHQSEKATRGAVSEILTPIGLAGMIIGAILVVGTCRVSTAIIKRFEHELLSINEGLEKAVRQRTKSLMKTRDAVIVGLAKLAESRDSDTGEHLERINLYSTKLAQAHAGQRRLDDPVVVESIGLASSLHDIGKVGVPDRVLLKAGKLDAEERSEIEKHPQVGEQCINEIETRLGEDGFLSLARDICAHHHERWDGTGYPYGISGERIPIAARLVAVADVYDALRSRRPYKEPLSHSAACKIIVDGMGTHFDPSVIQTFVEIHHEFEAISEQYLKPEMPVSSPLLNHTPALGSALAVPSID